MRWYSIVHIGALVLLSCTNFASAFHAAPHATTKVPNYEVKFLSAYSTCRHASVSDDNEDDLNLSYGEKSRRFRRTVYTHADWLKHRDSNRFIRNLATLVNSGIIRQLAKEVLAVAAVALIVVLWNGLIIEGYTDFQGAHCDPISMDLFGLEQPPSKYFLLQLPSLPFTLSSSAIGLLLVFRTNSSYARWDSTRQLWGLMINHSRNILRQAGTWSDHEIEPDIQKRQETMDNLAAAIWAFPRALKVHLIGPTDEKCFQEEVTKKYLFSPEQGQALINSRHRPSRSLYQLSKAVNALPVDPLRRIEIDKSIVIMGDCAGGCERMFGAPVPLVYTRQTARFVSLWMLFLPLALWSSFESSWNHFALIPASAVIAFFFFGIDELAIQLEEPFSILPLSTLVGNIEKSAYDMSSWYSDEINQWQPEELYEEPNDLPMPNDKVKTRLSKIFTDRKSVV